jgi:hypothetical protein
VTDPQQYVQQYDGAERSTQNDLTRFLRDDGANVFDPQHIWNSGTDLSSADVKTLLDAAAPGLQWFEWALIRYHRVWDVMQLKGFNGIDVPELRLDNDFYAGFHIDTTGDPMATARWLEFQYYDQQRGMDLHHLTDMASRVKNAAQGGGSLPSAEEMTNDLLGVANAAPELWQGQGGDAAQDHLAGSMRMPSRRPSTCRRFRRHWTGCRRRCWRSSGKRRASSPVSPPSNSPSPATP